MPAPFGKGAAGSGRSQFRRRVAADNFARWLSTNRSFPDPPGIGGLPPNLFTIHSSRFSKSARYRYRGGSGCTDQRPPCQRGVVLPLAKPGGFRRLAGFHIGLYFWESACCGLPQSRPRPPGAHRTCQIPLTREPFLCGIVLWCDPGLLQPFSRLRGK